MIIDRVRVPVLAGATFVSRLGDPYLSAIILESQTMKLYG